MVALRNKVDMNNKQGNIMKDQTKPVRHIALVKPLKNIKDKKSATLKAKGGEGCLPIR
ncbi:MAG: hypothetical protein KDD45_10105 [Bdellovibrionales bacterium]|nr:hypothetical protein [Bdellovibrionales bacterium]